MRRIGQRRLAAALGSRGFAGHCHSLIARDLNALDDHIIEAADGDFAAASRRLDKNCAISARRNTCSSSSGMPWVSIQARRSEIAAALSAPQADARAAVRFSTIRVMFVRCFSVVVFVPFSRMDMNCTIDGAYGHGLGSFGCHRRPRCWRA